MHVAIIPDGNRRWARAHGLPTRTGHEKGTETFVKVAERAIGLNVEWLTVWGSSVANLEQRQNTEVEILKRIFARGFQRILETEDVSKRGIRVRVIGEWERYLDEAARETARNVMRATEGNKLLNLTLLIAYDGDKDMLNAINAISKIAAEREGESPVIGSQVKERLATRDLPDVDLLIRTGGDPHLSNGFMMWETRNTQLAFPSCWWPDFTADLFQKTMEEYQTREKRFGK